jgi:predicted polyphosphate/ATP-dependent NAD kinase
VTTVGIVANPASGRDIRRLVAGASVFGNADKAGMVFRLLAGLGATGVERALMMPARDGLSSALQRQLQGRRTMNGLASAPFPELEELRMPLTSSAQDTTNAVTTMLERGVRAVVVLGGDGTHRVVAKCCGDLPICGLSTGTNNVFPEMREATVAGLAAGLVATGRGGPDALRREGALKVERDGQEPELALVDVAVSRARFIGARALWRGDDLTELFVTFASPSAVGLSAVAGFVQPVERGAGRGLHVKLADGPPTMHVPLAPGLVVPVAVGGHEVLVPGRVVALSDSRGSLALDGEREIERRRGEEVTVRLTDGPLTIDVDAVMHHAARENATALQPPQE